MKSIIIGRGFYDYLPNNFTGKVYWEFNGETWYLKNGKFYNTTGPALIYENGKKEYSLDGIFYTRDNWFQQLTSEQLLEALMNIDNFDEGN